MVTRCVVQKLHFDYLFFKIEQFSIILVENYMWQ